MNYGPNARTRFNELHEAWAAPRGTAYLCRKQTPPMLAEGKDFIPLHASRKHAEIGSLRAAGRIHQFVEKGHSWPFSTRCGTDLWRLAGCFSTACYAGSINLLLLSETDVRKVRQS